LRSRPSDLCMKIRNRTEFSSGPGCPSYPCPYRPYLCPYPCLCSFRSCRQACRLAGLVPSGLVSPGLTVPGFVVSGLVSPGLVVSGLAVSGLVVSGLVTPGFAVPGLPCRAWWCRLGSIRLCRRGGRFAGCRLRSFAAGLDCRLVLRSLACGRRGLGFDRGLGCRCGCRLSYRGRRGRCGLPAAAAGALGHCNRRGWAGSS